VEIASLVMIRIQVKRFGVGALGIPDINRSGGD
jgi:hypothetical protein